MIIEKMKESLLVEVEGMGDKKAIEAAYKVSEMIGSWAQRGFLSDASVKIVDDKDLVISLTDGEKNSVFKIVR